MSASLDLRGAADRGRGAGDELDRELDGFPAATVRPMTPRFGAVVEGMSAKEEISDACRDALLEALLEYKVLFLRAQHLTVEEQQHFAARFGRPFMDPLTRNIPDRPGMTTVTRVPHFHSDHMHMERPPKFSMLQLNAVPPVGGDTLFADLVSGYEDLSGCFRSFIDGLVGQYVSRDPFEDIEALYGKFFGEELSVERVAEIRAALVPHEHPIVRVIPETGRANYWVCERFTRRIKGLTDRESRAVLGTLFAHQLRPEYLIRWRWQVGDIAFWDHRTTLHAGVDDYGEAERHGQRASIEGEAPVGRGTAGGQRRDG